MDIGHRIALAPYLARRLTSALGFTSYTEAGSRWPTAGTPTSRT